MDLAPPRQRPEPTLDAARRRSAGIAQTVGLLASVAAVALITLTPRGRGWAWGSPAAEARWYLTGLHSTATMLQLAGNLLLLVVPFALGALRWPALRRFPVLAASALAAGSTIEFLQWALPLGRVVSPLDAVLNATGAIAAGLVVAQLRAVRPSGQVLPRAYRRSLPEDDAGDAGTADDRDMAIQILSWAGA